MVLLIFGERVKHIQAFSKSAKESLLVPFLKLKQNSIQSSYKIIEFTKLSTCLTTCQVISITGKTVDFHTITVSNCRFTLSLIIFWDSRWLSVLADISRSIYFLRIWMSFFSAKALHSRNWPSIDSSHWLQVEYCAKLFLCSVNSYSHRKTV